MYTIKPIIPRIIGIVCILFLGTLAAFAFRAGELIPSAIFFAMVGLGISIILISGTIEIDDKEILYRNLFAKYSIAWEDVFRIELHPGGSAIAFIGREKQLSVIGPQFWLPTETRKVLTFVKAKANSEKIQFVVSVRSMFRSSRRSRVT